MDKKETSFLIINTSGILKDYLYFSNLKDALKVAKKFNTNVFTEMPLNCSNVELKIIK